MGYKSISVAIVASVFCFGANAAITDNDTYTTDTVGGLDWLDLTETANMSYNQVMAEMGAGGSLAGWRYAYDYEISGFFDAFGGVSSNYLYYLGWSTENNGLFDRIAPLWGDLFCEVSACSPGEGLSSFLLAEVYTEPTYITTGVIYDRIVTSQSEFEDFVNIRNITTGRDNYSTGLGSALVREASVVPIPAAVWLFSSGLLSLIGVAQRKVHS